MRGRRPIPVYSKNKTTGIITRYPSVGYALAAAKTRGMTYSLLKAHDVIDYDGALWSRSDRFDRLDIVPFMIQKDRNISIISGYNLHTKEVHHKTSSQWGQLFGILLTTVNEIVKFPEFVIMNGEWVIQKQATILKPWPTEAEASLLRHYNDKKRGPPKPCVLKNIITNEIVPFKSIAAAGRFFKTHYSYWRHHCDCFHNGQYNVVFEKWIGQYGREDSVWPSLDQLTVSKRYAARVTNTTTNSVVYLTLAELRKMFSQVYDDTKTLHISLVSQRVIEFDEFKLELVLTPEAQTLNEVRQKHGLKPLYS